MLSVFFVQLKGSPPLTRGKVTVYHAYIAQHRITPAYAGKRTTAEEAIAEAKDHPRLRGEKLRLTRLIAEYAGSPPLTRGKVFSFFFYYSTKRITPAYAGKSRKQQAFQIGTGDHPRLRGEKGAKMYLACPHQGSPPLTRGKDQLRVVEVKFVGITPAYAGKRGLSRIPSSVFWDHPRLRGEKRPQSISRSTPRGSPPLTRGKAKPSPPELLSRRITPAYAGKSRKAASVRGDGGDHPRLRGEKSQTPLPASGHTGSPPLTRGKEGICQRLYHSRGITPAYAGKSFTEPTFSWQL